MKNKKPTSKILSAEERRRVWELHVNQNQNGLQLAKTFGVSKSAIYRILDGFKKEPPRARSTIPIPAAVKSGEFEKDPLRFRINKLLEVQSDLQESRERGSVHVLTNMHRFQLNLHDEITKITAEPADAADDMSADEIMHTIISTAAGLPPLLRQQLRAQLENIHTGKVLSFKKAE